MGQRVVSDNRQRLNVWDFEKIEVDEIRIIILKTYGLERARIYEVRIY